MEKKDSFVKTTLIGGLVFLIPIVVIMAILGKAIKIMMVVAKPLNKMIPIESVGGIAMVDILALVAVVLVCFLAGFFAKSPPGKKVFNYLDSKLLMLLPGYSFVKGMTGSIDKKGDQKVLTPVLAKFDDLTQIGFEVERTNNGLVAVYLPGSPDTWSGSVAYMTEDRVEPLDVDFVTASNILRRLGLGSKQLINSPIQPTK
jgi:uncharacterized membrane protein